MGANRRNKLSKIQKNPRWLVGLFTPSAHIWRGGNRTLDVCLIRTLLLPPSYAPVGPKGVEPLPFRLKGGSRPPTSVPAVPPLRHDPKGWSARIRLSRCKFIAFTFSLPLLSSLPA